MAQAALSRSIAALVASANDDGAVQVQLSAMIPVMARLPLCADERTIYRVAAHWKWLHLMVDYVGD